MVSLRSMLGSDTFSNIKTILLLGGERPAGGSGSGAGVGRWWSRYGCDKFGPTERNGFEMCFLLFFFNYYYFVGFFLLFRAAPMAYGSSQARGQIGVAAGSHSHRHMGSKLCLQPIAQLTATPDP